MKLSLIGGCVLCVLAASSVVAQDRGPITNAAQAIARADALTGLRVASSIPRATLVRLAQDRTPFLGKKNTGKPAWRVEYGKGSPRVFAVLLEPRQGHLLFLTWPYSSRALPTSRSAEKQLRSEGEVYSGYPDKTPNVSFVAALERLPAKEAREIEAVYVLHSHQGSQPKPVWIITLRGLPPIPAHGPHADTVPASQRNHLRYVVDASTGQVLFSTNTP